MQFKYTLSSPFLALYPLLAFAVVSWQCSKKKKKGVRINLIFISAWIIRTPISPSDEFWHVQTAEGFLQCMFVYMCLSPCTCMCQTSKPLYILYPFYYMSVMSLYKSKCQKKKKNNFIEWTFQFANRLITFLLQTTIFVIVSSLQVLKSVIFEINKNWKLFWNCGQKEFKFHESEK